MRLIKNWVLATFILTFLVIIAGGVVRTTQSGMGCPDWPTCFGKWIPPTNASQLPADFEKYLRKQDIDHTFNPVHTWIEYFNRLSGVLLGFFAIIQVILLFYKKTFLSTAYKLSLINFGVILLTGLFGALVVKFNLASYSISVHLLLAILLLQIQLAILLSLQSKIFYIPVLSTTKKLLIIFLMLVIIQAILGTTVRMYVDAISKVNHYEHREAWLVQMPIGFLIHRSFSWIVLAAALFISWHCKSIGALRNKVFILTGIILLSMVTGIILFYLNMPAIAQPIHLLLASFAITQIMSILLQTKGQKNME